MYSGVRLKRQASHIFVQSGAENKSGKKTNFAPRPVKCGRKYDYVEDSGHGLTFS